MQDYSERIRLLRKWGAVLRDNYPSMVHQWKNMLQAATDLEDLVAENTRLETEVDDWMKLEARTQTEVRLLRDAITAAQVQLHTATFSTNKGAADLAKLINRYLPEPLQKG